VGTLRFAHPWPKIPHQPSAYAIVESKSKFVAALVDAAIPEPDIKTLHAAAKTSPISSA